MSVIDKKSWQELRDHAERIGGLHLSKLFAESPNRFKKFKLRKGNILIDFSKQRITRETTGLLCKLARESDLSAWIDDLFSGDRINTSEGRPALHTALRLPSGSKLDLNGENIVDSIQETLARMDQIVTRIHAGQWRGYSGLPVDTIVSIGVGGSELGPLMASEALAGRNSKKAVDLSILFVS
ncbi:MAG: glucose-6-phosphate isomerase, partial [Gammaproteobacteria bacterium]